MLSQWFNDRWFQSVHKHNLVYNTCWEDPRLDRQALQIGGADRLMLITSAGCNALDYALDEPERIFAVDLNPLQNALLELKIACLRSLDFDQFFSIFGQGRIEHWDDLYRFRVRPFLPPWAARLWDTRGNFFDGSNKRRSFYFRGSAGYFAWLVGIYLRRIAKLGDALIALAQASCIDEQREIYNSHRIGQTIWSPMMRKVIRRSGTMALLGVPRSQRLQIDRDYHGGLEQFIIDRLEAVLTQLPLADNYFWRVYLTGCYTHECCPEYLKADNFERLREGLVDRITTSTNSVQGFLESSEFSISKFVLLDHMDWLYSNKKEALVGEWNAIVKSSTNRSRLLWRSAGLSVDFVDPVQVVSGSRRTRVGDLLTYHPELAASLHARDRVHTYGCFVIADLNK